MIGGIDAATRSKARAAIRRLLHSGGGECLPRRRQPLFGRRGRRVALGAALVAVLIFASAVGGLALLLQWGPINVEGLQSAHRRQPAGAARPALLGFDRPDQVDARRRRRRAGLRRHRHSRRRGPARPRRAGRPRRPRRVVAADDGDQGSPAASSRASICRLRVRPDGALSVAAAADADAVTFELPAPLPPGADSDGRAGFRAVAIGLIDAMTGASQSLDRLSLDSRPPRSGQRSAGQAHGLRRLPIVLRPVARDGDDRRRRQGAAGAVERRSAARSGGRGAHGVADRPRSRFRRRAAVQRPSAAVRGRHADVAAARRQGRRQFADREP